MLVALGRGPAIDERDARPLRRGASPRRGLDGGVLARQHGGDGRVGLDGGLRRRELRVGLRRGLVRAGGLLVAAVAGGACGGGQQDEGRESQQQEPRREADPAVSRRRSSRCLPFRDRLAARAGRDTRPSGPTLRPGAARRRCRSTAGPGAGTVSRNEPVTSWYTSSWPRPRPSSADSAGPSQERRMRTSSRVRPG